MFLTIEAETSIATQQKEEALKDLKTAQSGFLAKIFQPGKYKKEEAEKLKESYDAGAKETIGSFIKAAGLKLIFYFIIKAVPCMLVA